MADVVYQLCPECKQMFLRDSEHSQTLICDNDACDYTEYYGNNYN